MGDLALEGLAEGEVVEVACACDVEGLEVALGDAVGDGGDAEGEGAESGVEGALVGEVVELGAGGADEAEAEGVGVACGVLESGEGGEGVASDGGATVVVEAEGGELGAGGLDFDVEVCFGGGSAVAEDAFDGVEEGIGAQKLELGFEGFLVEGLASGAEEALANIVFWEFSVALYGDVGEFAFKDLELEGAVLEFLVGEDGAGGEVAVVEVVAGDGVGGGLHLL